MQTEILSSSPLFENISEPEFRSMLGCVGYRTETYDKGGIIILESDSVKRVGVVISGAVHMVKEDIWGNNTLVAHIGVGEIFGETFVFGSIDRSAVTFTAAENSEIAFLNFDKVVHSCGQSCPHHRKLADNMIHMIADKNLRLMEKIEITSKKTLREKILSYLSVQSQRCGKTYFEIPLGRVELANYLCADRSALTRELNTMRDEGIIDFDKNTFRIFNMR